MIDSAVRAIVECGMRHNSRSTSALYSLQGDGDSTPDSTEAATIAAATEAQIAAAVGVATKLHLAAAAVAEGQSADSTAAVEAERRVARAVAVAWVACKALGTADIVYLSLDEVVSSLFTSAATAGCGNAIASFIAHRCFGAIIGRDSDGDVISPTANGVADGRQIATSGGDAATPVAAPSNPPQSAADTDDAEFWATQNAWASHARADSAADRGAAACFYDIMDDSDADDDAAALDGTCVLGRLSRDATNPQERERQQRRFTRKILASEAQVLLQVGFDLAL